VSLLATVLFASEAVDCLTSGLDMGGIPDVSTRSMWSSLSSSPSASAS